MSNDAAWITLQVNGTRQQASATLADTLLTVLRDQFGLTAAKRGCSQGVCGSCTVLSDGAPVRACLSLALDCDDRTIETVEGLSDDRLMRELQQAFVDAAAFQCGFCTPGMLISAYALVRDREALTGTDVRNGLSGNLCRCTGYKKIVEAVLTASPGSVSGEGGDR